MTADQVVDLCVLGDWASEEIAGTMFDVLDYLLENCDSLSEEASRLDHSPPKAGDAPLVTVRVGGYGEPAHLGLAIIVSNSEVHSRTVKYNPPHLPFDEACAVVARDINTSLARLFGHATSLHIVGAVQRAEILQKSLDNLFKEREALKADLVAAHKAVSGAHAALQLAESTMTSLERMCQYLGERLLYAQIASGAASVEVQEAVAADLAGSGTVVKKQFLGVYGAMGTGASLVALGLALRALFHGGDLPAPGPVTTNIVNVFEAADACEGVSRGWSEPEVDRP